MFGTSSHEGAFTCFKPMKNWNSCFEISSNEVSPQVGYTRISNTSSRRIEIKF